jgi:hypothetical protein
MVKFFEGLPLFPSKNALKLRVSALVYCARAHAFHAFPPPTKPGGEPELIRVFHPEVYKGISAGKEQLAPMRSGAVENTDWGARAS